MSPHTSQFGLSTHAQTSLAKFGTVLSAVLGLAVFAPGAIAAPFTVSQVSPNPSDDSGDVIIGPGSSTSQPPAASTLSGTRFSCQVTNGQYTVMYQPESQPGQFYPWAVPSAMGGGWDPARRCSEITRRLESYRPDGLQEMQTGFENGYSTVCVTTQRVPSCRIVLTVPPGQDALATRDRVFQNLTVADSGQQTQGVNTFVSGNRSGILGEAARWLGLSGIGGSSNSSISSPYSNSINLRPFLDRADGGTGQFLRGRVTAPGRRLNPNNFR
ncbi:MAG: COP23 domain-containing protein [Leptolyngbyaceae cyanobacterium bins.302]|nr:COP23 domain-containing protein [Leptolyngbyaceae cyanobacterium bins.302]